MMNQREIKTICVCGAGTMGRGIAQIAAQNGFDCILYDVSDSMVHQSSVFIQQALAALVEKVKITVQQKTETLSRLQFASNIEDCTADLVIEAIVENPDVKIALFKQLQAVNKPDTILTSNTSSLAISRIAESISEPGRFAGMHFFNPAPVMKLIEIVKGNSTSDATIQTLVDVSIQLQKTPVICKDAPGFIVNHVARPYYIEALRLVEEELSNFETIDSLLESTGFKLGPFRLMDLIGNDVNYAVSRSVYEQLNQPVRLKPSPLQEDKVKAGELGKKTGRGYYDYF